MTGSILVIPLVSAIGGIALWLMGATFWAILAWFFLAGPSFAVASIAVISWIGNRRCEVKRRHHDKADPASD